MLILGDMIICGQKNGPVKPSPKTLGMVMLSENSYAFDSTMCKIMGFKYDMIKYIAVRLIYYLKNQQNVLDKKINFYLVYIIKNKNVYTLVKVTLFS